MKMNLRKKLDRFSKTKKIFLGLSSFIGSLSSCSHENSVLDCKVVVTDNFIEVSGDYIKTSEFSSEVSNKLNEIYNEYTYLHRGIFVSVEALNEITIDSNLKLSCNLILISRLIRVSNNVLLDLSGRNGSCGYSGGSGSHGSKGANGVSSEKWGDRGSDGGNGSNGSPGGCGLPGGNLLMAAETHIGLEKLAINLNGGNGGDGGRGGDGGIGGNGGNGHSPGGFLFGNGGSGGNGGRGGDGGDGGAGGKGSIPGILKVYDIGKEEDILKLKFRELSTKEGQSGANGSVGYAGSGGSGGYGKSGNAWGSGSYGGRNGSSGSSGTSGYVSSGPIKKYSYDIVHCFKKSIEGYCNYLKYLNEQEAKRNKEELAKIERLKKEQIEREQRIIRDNEEKLALEKRELDRQNKLQQEKLDREKKKREEDIKRNFQIQLLDIQRDENEKLYKLKNEHLANDQKRNCEINNLKVSNAKELDLLKDELVNLNAELSGLKTTLQLLQISLKELYK